MILRSLFFASLAEMAMVSCSNEDDQIIDNGGNAVKNAVMNLTIGLPQSTRSADDKDGTVSEQTVSKITAVLKYKDITLTDIVEFTQIEQEENSAKATTEYKNVTAGVADIFVYVNPKTIITKDNYATIQEKAEYSTSLDGLTTNIAKDNNFLMYGSTADFSIIAGKKDNLASVNVTRVAAKIGEYSPKTAFTSSDSKYTINGKKASLEITLQKYSFTNLANKTYVVPATQYLASAESDYFNYFTATKDLKDFDNLAATKAIGDKYTYCMENNSKDNKTTVYYQAQAIVGEEVHNLYVVGDILYPTFDALNEAYQNQLNTPIFGNLNDDSDYAAFNTFGIQKYENGICYYAREIQTGQVSEIHRNNFYKLTVTDIKDLGAPAVDVPDPNTPITMLGLDVTIVPWVVNDQNIEL